MAMKKTVRKPMAAARPVAPARKAAPGPGIPPPPMAGPMGGPQGAGGPPMMKKGGKVKAKKYKSGGTVSMQLGSYGKQIGKNYSGKGGGAKVGKCKNGC
jgi:hypothetical protein